MKAAYPVRQLAEVRPLATQCLASSKDHFVIEK